MSTALTLLVHTAHVLAGTVWFGGAVYMALLGAALLDRSPRETLPVLARLGRAMAASGSLVLVLGVVRGTGLGPVRSFHYLVSTAYGVTFAIALLVTVLLAMHGAITGRTLEAKLCDGDRWRADAARTIRRDNVISIGGMSVVVLCMCAMHFGL